MASWIVRKAKRTKLRQIIQNCLKSWFCMIPIAKDQSTKIDIKADAEILWGSDGLMDWWSWSMGNQLMRVHRIPKLRKMTEHPHNYSFSTLALKCLLSISISWFMNIYLYIYIYIYLFMIHTSGLASINLKWMVVASGIQVILQWLVVSTHQNYSSNGIIIPTRMEHEWLEWLKPPDHHW